MTSVSYRKRRTASLALLSIRVPPSQESESPPVGERIRQLREQLGITLEKLAFECGLSKGHLSKLERGLQSPTVETLALIAARLEVAAFDLLVDPGAHRRHRIVDRTRNLSDAGLRELETFVADLIERTTKRT